MSDRYVFHSGDRIRLHFQSNSDGNIALVQLGSAGSSEVLFPDPEKGLSDSRIQRYLDRVLPEETRWFKFDEHPGAEQILVFFARSETDLRSFPIKPKMDSGETMALAKSLQPSGHSKDLLIETETKNASEIGTYGVNLAGKPIVIRINLEHR